MMTPTSGRYLVRAFARAAALLAVSAVAASAQIRPPNIQGPINAAKKVAGKTSEQVKSDQNTGKDGNVGNGPLPAEAARNAQAAAQTQQKGAPPKAAPAQQKMPPAQQKATPPAQKGASVPPKSGGAPQKSGTTPKPGSTPQRGGIRGDSGATSQAGRSRGSVTVYRESFTYDDAGRRDPFVSLMLSGELRPVITDLVLTGVIYSSSGGSIAMLVDNSTGQNYGVRVGQTLGRMRVARISKESVTFDIDEFGLSRSETLIIDRSQTVAPRRP